MHTRGVMSRSRMYLLILLLLVLLPALFIRIHPTASESFAYDAIVSQMAAGRGFTANAMDRSNILWERRGHPPLLSYIILVNNRLFGPDEFGARIFSIVAGSICCLVVSLSIMIIMKGLRLRLACALFGGWMIILLPVHLYVSRTANWDAVYSLLTTCSLLFLSLYMTRNSLKNLLAAGAFAGLAFLACEIALLLVPVFAFALYKDLRRDTVSTVIKNWLRLVLIVLLLLALLWPAGIFKLDILRTIMFRARDSAIRERNIPWFMFYAELFDQAPAFTIVSALGFLLFLIQSLARRSSGGGERAGIPALNGMLVPFGIYVVTAAVMSTRQSLVYIHHIVDMFPPLAVVSSSMIFISSSAFGRAERFVLPVFCIVFIAFSAYAAANPDVEVVGPQEHPGFLGVRDFLRERPDARTYYYYASIMPYYLPQGRFEGGPPRYWTGDKIDLVKDTGYDFVVTDWAMFSEGYPDIEALSDALEPEYRLVHTVPHRRTGQPVAWIFSR